MSAAAFAGILFSTLLRSEPALADGVFRVTQLSEEGPAASDVHTGYAGPSAMRTTPNGERVVYLQDVRFEGVYELYSVRRDGTGHIRLSPELPEGARVDRFEVTPDGERVVFRMGNPTEGRFGLLIVPVEGPHTETETVYVDPDPLSSVEADFEITRDSSAVVLRTRREGVDGSGRVLRVGLGAVSSGAVELFPGDVAEDRPWGFWVSPVGAQTVVAAQGLYGVPLWGSAADLVRLDEGEATGPGRVVHPHDFSPDGLRFVFGKSDETTGSSASAVYSVLSQGPGSGATQVSPASHSEFTWARISEDSSTVCMRAIPAPGGRGEIFVAPIAGPASAAAKLSIPLFGLVGAGTCEFAEDSSTVVYAGDLDHHGDRALLAVPVEGPPEAAIRLSLPLDPPGQGLDWKVDSQSSALLYSGLFGGEGAWRLYRVPLAGPAGASEPLGPPFHDPEGYWAYTRLAPDGRSVALFADFGDALQYEIVVFDLDGSEAASMPVNPPLVAGGSVIHDFAWMPDSLGIAYRADGEIDEKFELFLADALIFADGFESGDESRWTGGTRDES